MSSSVITPYCNQTFFLWSFGSSNFKLKREKKKKELALLDYGVCEKLTRVCLLIRAYYNHMCSIGHVLYVSIYSASLLLVYKQLYSYLNVLYDNRIKYMYM